MLLEQYVVVFFRQRNPVQVSGNVYFSFTTSVSFVPIREHYQLTNKPKLIAAFWWNKRIGGGIKRVLNYYMYNKIYCKY